MLGSSAGSASVATAPSPSRAVAPGRALMDAASQFEPRFQRVAWAQAWWIAVLCTVLALLSGGARAAERTPFDHLITGFELTGQHRDLPCESCHVNALFKGTPRECSACHGVGVMVRATAKPPTHILTSNNCERLPHADGLEPRGELRPRRSAGQLLELPQRRAGAGQGSELTSSPTSNAMPAIRRSGGRARSSTTPAWSVAAPPATTAYRSRHAGDAHPDRHRTLRGVPHTDAYTSFSGAKINHSAVSPPMACAACHEAGLSFFGVSVVTRPAAPQPTSGDCGVCHTSTTSASAGLLQPANHIPTTSPAPCVVPIRRISASTR